MFETTAGAALADQQLSPRQQRERLVSELKAQGFTDTGAENLVVPAKDNYQDQLKAAQPYGRMPMSELDQAQQQKATQAQTVGDKLQAARGQLKGSAVAGIASAVGLRAVELQMEARRNEKRAAELESLAVKQMRGAAFLIEHPEFVEFLQLQREGII